MKTLTGAFRTATAVRNTVSIQTDGMNDQKRSTRQILEQNLDRVAPDPLRNIRIWLHNIRSMHNVGAAFRSCDAFGAGELILSGYTPVPPRAEITKTALGAETFVKWQQPSDPFDTIRLMKSGGLRFYGIEQTTRAKPLTGFIPPVSSPFVLCFGNEVTGLDDALLPLMDQCFEIPQFGRKHSLNLSVTIGICLYHVLSKASGPQG